MHILIIPSWYPKFPGDIQGSFFREQALALKKYGHQVGVIDVKFRMPRSVKSLFNGFFGTVSETDEGLLTLRFCGMDWFRLMPQLKRWLWLYHGMKLFKRYVSLYGKPDVVHAHAMLNGGVLAKSVSDRFGVPFVVTEHNTAYARGNLSQQQIKLALGVSTSAERRFAVSCELCKLLEQLFGSAESHWEEIPNIVERKFTDVVLPVRLSETEPFVFLSIALLSEKKAVNNLVSAFARAFSNDSDVVLKIGGDGVERPRLEALAVDLGVADRVFFLGMLSREQVLEEMSRSCVFVLPSRYETFGVVVIEALALGKPVIATRCGGPESIVRDQDGLLVPIDDVIALANAMEKMQYDYASYSAEEIRAACITRFSETKIAERLSTIYSEVLASTDASCG